MTGLPSTCNGTFQIVKAGLPSSTPLSEVVLGSYGNGSSIDIGPFNNTPLSIVILCEGVFSYLSLKYRDNTRLEYVVPYALKGNNKNNYRAEPDLNVLGSKSIFVKGYMSSTTIFETVLIFNIIKTDPQSTITSLYTTSMDFGSGIGINVEYKTDQVQLNSAAKPFEFIWVALSVTGTVVKIDTNTGIILGEYKTRPNYFSAYLISSAVDYDGSVWVANSTNYYPDCCPGSGSVVHIGLKENNQCEDRNNNGVIDTSTGSNDIKGWRWIGVNTNVSTADDECIIHYVGVNSKGTGRNHISINIDNDVWVSGQELRNFDLIKGGGPDVLVSGKIIRSELSVGYGGNGGLISDEILWSAGPLLRWNTSRPLTGENGDPDPSGPNIGPLAEQTNWAAQDYFQSSQICIDKDGNVWSPRYLEGTVIKYDKDGVFLGEYRLPSGGTIYGCVVDSREGGTNDVWIARSHVGQQEPGFLAVHHLRNDGTFVGTATRPLVSNFYGSAYGLAVDAKGKIWATNGNSRVLRIDPSKGELIGSTHVGAVDLVVPVTFNTLTFVAIDVGDMTGSNLRSAPTTGNWRVTIDRTDTNFDWNSTTVSWDADVPDTSKLLVTVASSINGTLFSAPKSVVNGSRLNSGIPTGRYLQVQISLQRQNRSSRSPILHELKVVS